MNIASKRQLKVLNIANEIDNSVGHLKKYVGDLKELIEEKEEENGQLDDLDQRWLKRIEEYKKLVIDFKKDIDKIYEILELK